MQLEGKVAIVTGGAKGIGGACSRVFASHGACVVIADVDEKVGKATEGEIRSAGGQALFVPTDVSSSPQVQALIAKAVETYGRLTTLVNNAAITLSKDVEETTEEEWARVLGVNLTSVFLCSKYAMPEIKRHRGSIINISSMVGLIGQKNRVAYAAAKGGIVALTKSMALDYAAIGVRVNAICPGFVRTPMVEDWLEEQADPEATRKYVDSIQPMGRVAESEEIATVAAFLASDAASYVTGVALPVDGAVTLGY